MIELLLKAVFSIIFLLRLSIIYVNIFYEFITKLTAVCTKCGAPATRTQRLVNGKPASFNDSIVLVGAVEHYEPRCRHCHEVVDKPNKF